MALYHKLSTYVTFTSLVTSSLLFLTLSGSVKAQNWDDVGFWTADFALNTLQRQAEAEQLEQYRQTYVVLRDGYKIVRGLVSDNHKLHETFFKELASVNPVVENYYKVHLTFKIYSREVKNIRRDAPQIIRLLRNSHAFTEEEIKKVERTFDKMVKRIGRSFDELSLVILDSSDGLEMMDSERILLIERVYEESIQITSSVRSFRLFVLNLAAQRTNTTVSNLETLFRAVP